MRITFEHILTIVGILLTLSFSIIAVIQSFKANKLSKKANKFAEKANEIAEKTLKETQKDHLPILNFVETVTYEILSYEEARHSIIYDFGNCVTDEMNCDRDVPVIKMIFSNSGTGIILGIQLKHFYLYAGDDSSFNDGASVDAVLLSYDNEKEEDIVLIPGTNKTVYVSIPLENKDHADRFFKMYPDFVIATDVVLVSVGDNYPQGAMSVCIKDSKVIE